ncbi:MAG: zinc-ribbon domain-containing protein [Methanobacteriota archaeon]
MTGPGFPATPVPMPSFPQVIIKPETFAGIKTYKVNLVLDLVFSAFALTIALVAILISVSDPFQAISFVAIITASACGLVIVFVINFIVSLLSVTKMHHGIAEYGPEHERHASRGVLFKWLGTAMSTAAAVLVVYLLVSGLAFVSLTGQLPTTVYVPLLITVFWTTGVTFKGQMYRNMVRALQPPETRRWSDVASLVIPILGILGIVAVGVATARIVAAFSNPSSLTPVEFTQLTQIILGGIFLPPGLALFGYILFLVVYNRTSDLLQRGLHEAYARMAPPSGWPPYGFVPPAAVAYPGWVPAPAGPGTAPSAQPAWVPAESPTPAPVAPGPSTKTCPSCGHAIPATVAFCPDCGARAGA